MYNGNVAKGLDIIKEAKRQSQKDKQNGQVINLIKNMVSCVLNKVLRCVYKYCGKVNSK